MRSWLLAIVLLLVLPCVGFAASFVAYGPENFIRQSGPPTTITRTFTVLDPNTTYTLVIQNGGLNNEFQRVSSAVVTVNGVLVLQPNDFSQSDNQGNQGNQGNSARLIQRTVSLRSSNTFTVELRGARGSGFALAILGVDNVPPTITASADRPPNAAGWYNATVVVSFTCLDKTSGVASCPAPVTMSTEGATQNAPGPATDNDANV